ncbi:hypothetical protein AB3S75_002898 [Citrus x aurantiifolia]
MASEG